MKSPFALAFILGLAFYYPQVRPIQAWINVEKEQYKIQSPPTWTIDSSKTMGADLFLFSQLEDKNDKFRENINVLIQDLTGKNIDLNQYAQISEKQIKTLAKDPTIFVSKRIHTPVSEYHKMIYSTTQGNSKLKFEQYYFIKNNKAFVITLSTELDKFESFKTIGEKILDSFVLK